MVWRLARSEASPPCQPAGPGRSQITQASLGSGSGPGRATWRHSDGARAHSQMPAAQHCGGPGTDATRHPPGPGQCCPDWPRVARTRSPIRDSEVASPGPGRRSQFVAFARHFARAGIMCRVIESPGPRKLSSRPSLLNYSLHLT